MSRPPRVRVLSKEEIDSINRDVARHLGELEQTWKKKHDFAALLGALFFCEARLPRWLFVGLRDLLTERLPTISEDETRHEIVLGLRDVAGLSWKRTLAKASELLEGTLARGKPSTMRRSYEKIERALPPDARRRKTYRRGK